MSELWAWWWERIWGCWEKVSDCVAVGLELAIGHLGKPCEQLVTLSIWSMSQFLTSACSLTFQRPPALLLHWASLLVTKSSSGYRMPSKILPWISVFECTRVDLCTYKTLSKWSSWDVTAQECGCRPDLYIGSGLKPTLSCLCRHRACEERLSILSLTIPDTEVQFCKVWSAVISSGKLCDYLS